MSTEGLCRATAGPRRRRSRAASPRSASRRGSWTRRSCRAASSTARARRDQEGGMCHPHRCASAATRRKPATTPARRRGRRAGPTPTRPGWRSHRLATCRGWHFTTPRGGPGSSRNAGAKPCRSIAPTSTPSTRRLICTQARGVVARLDRAPARGARPRVPRGRAYGPAGGPRARLGAVVAARRAGLARHAGGLEGSPGRRRRGRAGELVRGPGARVLSISHVDWS